MAVLPQGMEQYAGLLSVVLLFIDGLLFGLAVKKAIVSVIMLAVAVVLAGYVGLSLPFLSPSSILQHVVAIAASQYNHIGALFVTLPIFFVVGIAIGIWKG